MAKSGLRFFKYCCTDFMALHHNAFYDEICRKTKIYKTLSKFSNSYKLSNLTTIF